MKQTHRLNAALPLAVMAVAAAAPAQAAPTNSLRPLPPAVGAKSQTSAALPSATVIPRYGKFEGSWTLPRQTGNPFDPQDNDIKVVFDGPSKAQAVVPAFWDGDRWRVRFAPTLVGHYTFHVLRGGKKAETMGLTPRAFQCAASQSGGFVRAKAGPAPRFVLDNGQPYYPFGMDVAWTGGTEPSYSVLLHTMGGNGMNWARIWMNYWDGKALDWSPDKAKNPPPGFLLLDAARKWDGILDAAAQNNVYVQMTLQHHGPYTKLVDSNWADNPWNAANGGFLQRPDDFFTNAQARRLTRAKYRYIVARWGYSAHLLSWELFNEVQNIGEAQTHFQDVVAWHKEMAACIRSLDVNHHLVTTSNSEPGTPLAGIGLDYNQIHTYPPDMVSYFAALHPGVPVPTFVGEWGYGGSGSPADKEVFLHRGIWAGIMAPTAGAGQFWYGDAVAANNWWRDFGSAAGFLHTLSAAQIASAHALSPAASAPGPLADLSFAPPDGWGPTTLRAVTLAPDGSAPHLSGVSSYVQGANHRDLLPAPVVFSLQCRQPCEFRLELGAVASAGAHPVLTLDGRPAQEHDFPAAPKDHDAGQTVSVSVPAGAHAVSVFNTGPDWFVLNRIVVTHYAPPIMALARGTNKSAVFWTEARSGGAAKVQGARLLFPALLPGAYTVRLWDIARARALPPVRVKAAKMGLAVSLPAFSQDIAGVVVRQ